MKRRDLKERIAGLEAGAEVWSGAVAAHAKDASETRRTLAAMTTDNAADLFAERAKNDELTEANTSLTETVTELRRDITDLAAQVRRHIDEASVALRQLNNEKTEHGETHAALMECRELVDTERRHADAASRERDAANRQVHALQCYVQHIADITAVGDRILAALVKRHPEASRHRAARDWRKVTADYRTEEAS